MMALEEEDAKRWRTHRALVKVAEKAAMVVEFYTKRLDTERACIKRLEDALNELKESNSARH